MNFSKKNHDFLKANKIGMSKIIIIVALLMMSVGVFAQKEIKEGVMTMKVLMSSDNEQMKAAFSMMGDMSTTTYFKGQKSRSEMKNPMAGETTTIVDNDAKTTLVFMNNPMLGKKYLKQDIKTSEEDLKNVSVTENGETKTVLDYKCKGYDIVTKQNGKELKMKMFVTDKILAQEQYSAMLGGKLKGFPMYLEMIVEAQPGVSMTTTIEVSVLKAESVDDSKFDMTIPEGYTEMEIPKQ